ncbi:arginine--tRNA ligase [Candidatus Micrarchaeota archaeon]|nr:arginine--tRNA ligase [Candidatus Micrarchaeota archaeon]
MMFSRIMDEIAGAVAEAAEIPAGEARQTIEMGRFGDLSSRAAFVLAKNKKENPAKLAQEISKKIKKPESVEKVEASGPYINFFFSNSAFASILSEILEKGEDYGRGSRKKKKAIIEFPSVNPNKPWHVGHLRNALLGDSIARTLEFNGYQAERMDYIDDLGLQVAQSLWGFLNYDSEPAGKFDAWLGEQYVGIAKRFEEEKEVVKGVRDTLQAMEEGDNQIAAAARDMAEKCVKAQYQTAFDFGIYHDVLVFESDIMRTLFEDGVELLKQSDAVFHETEGKNAGCWAVRFPPDSEFGKMENPDKVLIRSDGTAVYTGKDVIFHLWKFGKLQDKFRYSPFIDQPGDSTAYMTSPEGEDMEFGGSDRAVNVIGVEQKYPQKVIVQVLNKLDFAEEAEKLHHLSYEHVALPEGKFSGRRGTWVGYTADDLLEEAREKVLERIKLDVPEKERQEISKVVGAGAIKFSFLRTSSEKRITFKWEEALNMEGDSGPYLQYAYVRTKGILRKSEETPAAEAIEFSQEEKQLLKRLTQISEVSARCGRELAPHHLAQYALDISTDFSRFYTTSPVLGAESESVRKTRLAITRATSIVLRNTLNLMGLECPERM